MKLCLPNERHLMVVVRKQSEIALWLWSHAVTWATRVAWGIYLSRNFHPHPASVSSMDHGPKSFVKRQ